MKREHTQEEIEFLKNYNPKEYESPSVTVDILIFSLNQDLKLQVLLIRRKNHPYQGQWAVPGGFVHIHESVSQAAVRELKEETNLEGIYLEQLYTFGEVDRDPRMRVISVAHMALVPRTLLNIQAGDDAAEAKLFVVCTNDGKLVLTAADGEQITEADMAFDHEEILRMGLERLRGKVTYTDIAFEFLENRACFTIFELYRIYEEILGTDLDLPNFRRNFKKNYIDTNKVAYVGEVKSYGAKKAHAYQYSGVLNS